MGWALVCDHCYAPISNNCLNLQYLPQFVTIMKPPKFVKTFALICNRIKLPLSVTQACPNL